MKVIEYLKGLFRRPPRAPAADAQADPVLELSMADTVNCMLSYLKWSELHPGVSSDEYLARCRSAITLVYECCRCSALFEETVRGAMERAGRCRDER